MRTWIGGITILTAAMLLGGCAASVKNVQESPGYKVNGHSYRTVSVSLSEQAKKELPDNLKFDPGELKKVLHRALEARSLVSATGDSELRVVVTDIRVRSTFSAVMFGFMAGDDHVVGDIQVLDATGRPVHSYQVSASYALGGLAGGQDNARMDWLYEKFAELTVKELTGEASE